MRFACPASLVAVTLFLLAASTARAQDAPPPCAAGVEPAVEFDGLPGRMPYGPQRIFSLVETFADDYAVDGSIQVRMADAATDKAFFSGDVDPDEELFLQLDLDDDPVVITATFDQADWLDPDTSECRQTISRTVRGYRRLVLPGQCFDGVYRPRTVIIACGDGNYQLRGLRWRGWDRSSATAHGRAWLNDCVPFCAAGRFHSYRVRVRASRIRRCPDDDDRYRYTRLRVTYTGARPARSPRRETLRMPCLSAG
jgi:hypothetical protein